MFINIQNLLVFNVNKHSKPPCFQCEQTFKNLLVFIIRKHSKTSLFSMWINIHNLLVFNVNKHSKTSLFSIWDVASLKLFWINLTKFSDRFFYMFKCRYYNTRKFTSLHYSDTYVIMHNIRVVYDSQWNYSLSIWYIDKESCHRLSETPAILYMKHLSK